MTPKPQGRVIDRSPSAIASAKALARIPTANSLVDRCGWSRIDTLSLVNTSPCLNDAADDDDGCDEDVDDDNRGGGGGEGGRGEGGGGRKGIFLTQIPNEVWDEVCFGLLFFFNFLKHKTTT